MYEDIKNSITKFHESLAQYEEWLKRNELEPRNWSIYSDDDDDPKVHKATSES